VRLLPASGIYPEPKRRANGIVCFVLEAEPGNWTMLALELVRRIVLDTVVLFAIVMNVNVPYNL
jgi:hypothetical protein